MNYRRTGRGDRRVFNTIARAANCIWGVDLATLTVFFHAPSTTAAPYTLTPEQLMWDSSTFELNRQDYRNRQIIQSHRKRSRNRRRRSRSPFHLRDSRPTSRCPDRLVR